MKVIRYGSSFLSFVFLVCLLTFNAYSQKVSEQQEIAIFSSYYVFDIPSRVVNRIDDGIVDLFVSMKRFKVRGYQFRFSEKNLSSFLEKLTKAREERITGNIQFVDPKWGTITFTPEDLDRLLKSEYIIIPTIKEFKLNKLRGTYVSEHVTYSVFVEVSIKVFDPEKGKVIGEVVSSKLVTSDNAASLVTKTVAKSIFEYLLEVFLGIVFESTVDVAKNVKVASYNLTREETLNICVDEVLRDLEEKIKGIEPFKAYSLVCDFLDGRYFMELGRNYDIEKGREFDVVKDEVVSLNGVMVTNKRWKGAVKVLNVEEDFSEIIVVAGQVKIGDQLVDSLLLGWNLKFLLGVQQVEYFLPENLALINYFINEWEGLSNKIVFSLELLTINEDKNLFFEPQFGVSLLFSKPIIVSFSEGFNYIVYLGFGRVKFHLGMDQSLSFSYFRNVSWNNDLLDLNVGVFSLGFDSSIILEWISSKHTGFSVEVGYKTPIFSGGYLVDYSSLGGKTYDTDPFDYSYIPSLTQKGLFVGGSFFLRF